MRCLLHGTVYQLPHSGHAPRQASRGALRTAGRADALPDFWPARAPSRVRTAATAAGNVRTGRGPWFAFVLLAATYIPRNQFKARWHHPMWLATKLWALAHLLANGTLAGIVLFGSFLVWAIVMFASARRRDRRAGVRYELGLLSRTLASVLVGTLAWAVFAFWLHGLLIGILPLS